MKKKTVKFLLEAWTHLRFFAETYLGIPMAFLLLWLALHYFQSVTLRSSPDQPDQIVGMSYNAFGALLVFALTGFGQWRLFGYRSKTENPTLCDDIYDSVITFLLLAFACFLVFHK